MNGVCVPLIYVYLSRKVVMDFVTFSERSGTPKIKTEKHCPKLQKWLSSSILQAGPCSGPITCSVSQTSSTRLGSEGRHQGHLMDVRKHTTTTAWHAVPISVTVAKDLKMFPIDLLPPLKSAFRAYSPFFNSSSWWQISILWRGRLGSGQVTKIGQVI